MFFWSKPEQKSRSLLETLGLELPMGPKKELLLTGDVHQTSFILVGPEELNAQERLRVQLWDSDRVSADDDLGRIEVDLKELMHSQSTLGKMCDRTDGFQALEGDDTMPGTLDWSVGYFPKTRIQQEELDQQKVEEDVKSIDDLKKKVSKDAERKLREASTDQSHELEQQKAQDLKNREDAMIVSTPPLHDYPTGIFSIQIHQITGLEFEKINKNQGEGNRDEGDETMEGAGDLPSSYATVILNHEMIFKTRTKPKNAKPFFNAGTERMVRDWRTTEVMVSVRDSRVHENDPLLGIVYLPLGRVFKERSQVSTFWFQKPYLSLFSRGLKTCLRRPEHFFRASCALLRRHTALNMVQRGDSDREIITGHGYLSASGRYRIRTSSHLHGLQVNRAPGA